MNLAKRSDRSPQRSVVHRRAAVVATAAGAAILAVTPAAHADPASDAFLNALNNAGVGYTDSGAAADLGKSVCAMLKEPSGNFARAATSVTNTNGISPDTAALFTTIAVTTYCPSMMSSVATGGWWDQILSPSG